MPTDLDVSADIALRVRQGRRTLREPEVEDQDPIRERGHFYEMLLAQETGKGVPSGMRKADQAFRVRQGGKRRGRQGQAPP